MPTGCEKDEVLKIWISEIRKNDVVTFKGAIVL